jgi:hypothetical protein
VAGHCRAHADLRRFLVAHFAEQDDVRILAQRGAQHAAEGQVDLFVHLHLVETGQPVFDRILDGDDLLFRACSVR